MDDSAQAQPVQAPNMMGMQYCSTDVFSAISSLISAYDLARLFFCGNGAVIRLIRAGATHLDCSLTSYGRNRWPNFFNEITHLRALTIGHKSENPDFRGPFLPNAIFLAPLTHLRSLKLYFANAFLSLFRPVSQLDFTEYRSPKPIDFATLLPSLQLLHATNAYSSQMHRFKSRRLFKALGALPLIELFLEPFSVSASDFSLLPQTLETLKIKPFEMLDDVEDPVEWPPGLQTLTLKRLSKPLLYVGNLPKTLRSLSIHALYGDAGACLERLPSRLRRLTMKSQVFNFDSQEYALLPKKLDYLKLHLQLMMAPVPSSLPRTLRHFVSYGNWGAAITASDTDFPPFLKTFTASRPLDDAVLMALPDSIERYTIENYYLAQRTLRPLHPNLNYYNIMDTSVEALTMLNGAALRTLELTAYGPSPAAVMSRVILTKAHFDAIDTHAPNLRRLVIHSVMYSVDMRNLAVPLESFEMANCYDLDDFLDPNAPLPPDSALPPVKEKKSKKDVPAGELHPWSRNLQSLVIWGIGAPMIRHPKEFALRLPPTLKVLRLFHKYDPIPLTFDGSEIMKHLPPRIEEFAAFFSPMPSPLVLAALPKTLHTLHLGARHSSDVPMGLTQAHLEALPYSLTDILIPPSPWYPSEDFLDVWCQDRPELVRFRIFYDINSDPTRQFLFLTKSAPATSFATAISGTITDRRIPVEIPRVKEKSKGNWLTRLFKKG